MNLVDSRTNHRRECELVDSSAEFRLLVANTLVVNQSLVRVQTEADSLILRAKTSSSGNRATATTNEVRLAASLAGSGYVHRVTGEDRRSAARAFCHSLWVTYELICAKSWKSRCG